MSELHRQKTISVTQEYSRRHEKATLQNGTHLVESQGWAPKAKGGHPVLSANEVQPHGYCLHRL